MAAPDASAHRQHWLDAGIPYGECLCGCGQKTAISPKTSLHHGYVRAEPRRYVKGHNGRVPDVGLAPQPCKCGCGRLAPLAPCTDTTKGWIKGHPLRWCRGHNTAKQPVAPVDYIKDAATGCWVWQRTISAHGYGIGIGSSRRRAPAHRVIYERECGPIPGGMHLDHLCRNRACVNPNHLEPVSPAENTRRSQSAKIGYGGAQLARQLRATTVLTLDEIGAMLGVSRATVGDAISGRSWAPPIG